MTNIRLGFGYDVHKLVKGRPLILCGIEIPYEKGLLGHSDADVAIHALIDALFGAACMGDIGQHFPDTEEKYRGISSIILLENTIKTVKKAGFSLVNVDITIVAERPKLAPYISQMKQKLASVLGCSESIINIKAKTNEGLGFCGRGEGIVAYAAVLLEKTQSGGVNERKHI